MLVEKSKYFANRTNGRSAARIEDLSGEFADGCAVVRPSLSESCRSASDSLRWPMATSNDPNSYSRDWFELFHVGISSTRTDQETAFIRHCCPLPSFARLLDLCCGMGRHARALAAQDYTVTGVERDARAVAAARDQGGGPTYIQSDVRDYRPEPASFDAAVIMSQSYGYFEPEVNRELLGRLSAALRIGGRIVLDLWNPDFFFPRQGQRRFELAAGSVQETTRMENGRLYSRLDYPSGGRDEFEFQTFTAAEMASFAQAVGLTLVTACTDFSASVAPSSDKPRIQFVLERR
jgi:SAM-dependent methyltransferase